MLQVFLEFSLVLPVLGLGVVGSEFYDDDVYVGIERPNQVELELLKKAGWEYDGAFAHKKGE